MRGGRSRSKRYNMKRLQNRLPLTISVISVSALSILSAAGCKPNPPANTGAVAVHPAVSQASTPVVVTPVSRQTISRKIDVTGTLNTPNDVTVGVKIAGRISAVYFREGDRVRAGQIVAQQDTADLKAQYDQAYANYLAAESKLAQSRTSLQNALTTVKWTKDQTSSAVKQAEAALRAANEQAAIVKRGARDQERQQAQENVDAAKAERDRAQADLERAASEQRRTASDLKRYQDLAKQDAIAAQQLDQAKSAAESADAALSSGKAAFNSADERYRSALQGLSLIKEGSRPEDIRHAQDLVDQAKQALVAAKSNVDQVALRNSDVENMRSSIKGSEAGVRQAAAALNLARQALNDASIVSPITGIVAERKAEPGMQLAAGKDVLRIVALTTIYFDAQLPETQYSFVRVNQPVEVRVDAVPGTTFPGAVSKIFPVASATARSFTVRVTISNASGRLRPNLFARGQVTVETHPNVLVVPRSAVLDLTGNNGSVFVLAGDHAERRKVTIGIDTMRDVEIRSGLHEGDKVITAGQASVQDGDKIRTTIAERSGPALNP